MLSVPRVDAGSQRMLRRLLRGFGDVTVIPRGSPVPSWEPTRLNARFGGRVEDQVRYHLDRAGQVPLRPDIIWKVGGTAAAVIDAKYKAEKPAGYPNADLYQLLAYCTILGLPVGHLVYARGNASPARHVVRQSGIEICCHAIDLSQPPDQLIGQMNDLAGLVAAAAVASCRYPV